MTLDRKDGIGAKGWNRIEDRDRLMYQRIPVVTIRSQREASAPIIILDPVSLFFPLTIATMVIKNNDHNQDSIIIQQGNANCPGSTVSGPDLRIIQECSAEDPYTILESSTGERVYAFGPVFESEEDRLSFKKSFEEHTGVSLDEFLAPYWIAFEQYMAEQEASGEAPATNE